MPQVTPDMKNVILASGKGVLGKCKPTILKPSQIDFDPVKIMKFRNIQNNTPIIITADNWISDGHHRWASWPDWNIPMDVIQLKYDLAGSFQYLHDLAGVKTESVDSSYLNKHKIPGSYLFSIDKPINNNKFTFVITKSSNEITVSEFETGMMVTAFTSAPDKNLISDKLDDFINKIGDSNFLKVIKKAKDDQNSKQNDTDWELYSVYKTIRGSVAFVIDVRTYQGKQVFRERDGIGAKVYLGIAYNGNLEKLKTKFLVAAKTNKMKLHSGQDLTKI